MANMPESQATMATTPEATKAVPKLSKLAEVDHESPLHSIDSDMTTEVIPELPACPDTTTEVIYELTVTTSRF